MPPDLKGPINAPAPPSSGRPATSSAINGQSRVPDATARHDQHDDLRLLVNSRHPIITVETPEEERFEQMLLEVATELSVPLYEWSVTTGLAKYHGSAIYNSEQPD